MKFTRTVVRLSALAVATMLVLPIVVSQVSAYGSASRNGFETTPVTLATSAPADERPKAPPPQTTVDRRPKYTAAQQDPPKPADSTLPALSAEPATSPTSTPTSTDGSDPVVTTQSVERSTQTVLRGTVKRTRNGSDHWRAVDIKPTATGRHKFKLKWSGNGNLMFSLRDTRTGKFVADNRSNRSPKVMVAKLQKGRTYELGVWTRSGRGEFAVIMSAPGKATTSSGSTPPDDEEPAPPPPSPTPPTPPPVTGSGYPGQPAAGTLLWGAAIGGNSDPVSRHESSAGHVLTVRRTFWRWDQRTSSMISTARNDLSKGRLPWVSVKTPSWTAMANGDHDAAIDEMLRALDGLNGPVWLTIHHEPEGGGGVNSPDDPGGPSAHVDMNRRVRERMTALGTDNIALAPVLMSWTFDSRSGRNPNDWWAPGIYDFFGVDHYVDSQKTLLDDTWYKVRSWAANKGVDVAVGEWGMRGTDDAAGDRVYQWYNDAAGSHRDGRGARVVGLAAFDSALNAPTGSWELKGAQLEAFQALLKDSRTADPR